VCGRAASSLVLERGEAMLRIVKSVGIAIALGWITSQMILRAQRK
jgi:hypothetical protein